MIKQKTSKQKLLPLALLPLFSVAVLAGCGSDDDDDGGAVVTPPAEEGVVIGDADGNGVADAFETATTGGDDANGNGIDDAFDSTVTGGQIAMATKSMIPLKLP